MTLVLILLWPRRLVFGDLYPLFLNEYGDWEKDWIDESHRERNHTYPACVSQGMP